MFCFFYEGSKGGHDNSHDQDGIDAKDHSDLQAIQNHNLLIALGGVTRGATTHFPMSVSTILYNQTMGILKSHLYFCLFFYFAAALHSFFTCLTKLWRW